MDFERVPTDIVVVTGVGDMGFAATRRLAAGRRIVLVDFSADNLSRRAEALRVDGHFAEEFLLDVADRDRVFELAEYAASLGTIRTLFNTPTSHRPRPRPSASSTSRARRTCSMPSCPMWRPGTVTGTDILSLKRRVRSVSQGDTKRTRTSATVTRELDRQPLVADRVTMSH